MIDTDPGDERQADDNNGTHGHTPNKSESEIENEIATVVQYLTGEWYDPETKSPEVLALRLGADLGELMAEVVQHGLNPKATDTEAARYCLRSAVHVMILGGHLTLRVLEILEEVSIREREEAQQDPPMQTPSQF